jgi:hypothetical protein
MLSAEKHLNNEIRERGSNEPSTVKVTIFLGRIRDSIYLDSPSGENCSVKLFFIRLNLIIITLVDPGRHSSDSPKSGMDFSEIGFPKYFFRLSHKSSKSESFFLTFEGPPVRVIPINLESS